MSAFSSAVPEQVCIRTDELVPTAEQVLGWIDGALGTVMGWLNSAVSWVTSVFGDFGVGSLFSAISDAFQSFQDFVADLREAARVVVEFIKGVFMPWIMPTYAQKWQRISELMIDVEDLSTPEGLRGATGSWTGETAGVYKDFSLHTNQAAGFGARTAAEQAELLTESAEQGQAFYSALLGLLVSIILAVLAIAAEVAGIVTIPAAVATVLTQVVPIIGEIVELVQESTALVEQQGLALSTVEGNLAAATDMFPNGIWPSPSYDG